MRLSLDTHTWHVRHDHIQMHPLHPGVTMSPSKDTDHSQKLMTPLLQRPLHAPDLLSKKAMLCRGEERKDYPPDRTRAAGARADLKTHLSISSEPDGHLLEPGDPVASRSGVSNHRGMAVSPEQTGWQHPARVEYPHTRRKSRPRNERPIHLAVGPHPCVRGAAMHLPLKKEMTCTAVAAVATSQSTAHFDHTEVLLGPRPARKKAVVNPARGMSCERLECALAWRSGA